MKRTIAFLLFVISLASCSPSAITSTVAPTQTAVATVAVEPTITPTPIPTIQVDGISVPDPQVINPELFNLSVLDSPISQLINALTKAGIAVDLQQILSQFENPQDFKVINGAVIATYTTADKDVFPVIIYKQNSNKERKWETVTPEIGVKVIKGNDFFAGASLGGSDISIPENMDSAIKSQFSANTLEGWHWKYFEPTEGTQSPDYQSWDNWMLRRYSSQILTGHPLYFPENNPSWLQGKSDSELLKILETHIENIVKNNSQINRWVVVNEPNESSFPDIYHKHFGNDIYLKMFQWTHQANSSATLILNDYNNDEPKSTSYDYGDNTSKIQNILTILKTDPGVYKKVHVGIQMHFHTDQIPDIASIINTINQYDVPVDITELTVKQTANEKISQADIYRIVGEVVKKSNNVKSITFWGVGDTKQNKGITIFIDNQPTQPSLAYYYFLLGLFGF